MVVAGATARGLSRELFHDSEMKYNYSLHEQPPGHGDYDAEGSTIGALSDEDSADETRIIDEGEDVDLEASVYDAAIFSLIHDGIEILTKTDHDSLALKLNIARCFFVVVSLLFNYALQLGLICWTNYYVVAPAVREVQVLYRHFHAEVYDTDGKFLEDNWVDWPEENKARICGLVFSNWRFLYLMLALWWMAMLDEFRKTDRLRRNLADMDHTRYAEKMISSDEDGIKRIRRLVRPVRWTLYTFLVLPKYIINVALLILGTMWLTATQSFSDLILNCVALGFVIEIDELIFDAMFPARMTEQMEHVKLFRAQENTRAGEQRAMRDGYMRSAAYWMAILLLVFVYIKYGQAIPYIGVLPGYTGIPADSCPIYWKEMTAPVCDPWGALRGEQCFPFGGDDAVQAPHPEVLR